MNKQTTCNVATPLYWSEADALEELAKQMGMPKAGVLRFGLFELLKVHLPAKAKELTRARITRNAQTTICGAICLFAFLSAYAQSLKRNEWQDFRQGNRLIVRSVRRQDGGFFLEVENG